MPPDALLPRAATARFERALGVMPVIALTGARQTGKSTFVRRFAAGNDGESRDSDATYVSLESATALANALANPEAFVRREGRLIIDEVQRAPRLLNAIKDEVDRVGQDTPGRFVLTGSANLLLMKTINETLAGRAAYLTLWPMTRREQLGFGSAGIWSELLATDVARWPELIRSQNAPYEDWRALARRGGYPRPAYGIRSDDDRAVWFEGYLDTYLGRDVPELSPIANLPQFRMLMRAMALRIGTLVNHAQLARDVRASQSTIQRYADLLETSYQAVPLPAYASSRRKRLIKSPKLYWSDSGLAMFLAGEHEPRGEHLENVVFCDLLAWKHAQTPTPDLFYWRTSANDEVDFVIEHARQLLPIEVKATTQPSTGDMRSLRLFLDEYEDRVPGGLVLYGGPDGSSNGRRDGDGVFWIGDRILAVPWWTVL